MPHLVVDGIDGTRSVHRLHAAKKRRIGSDPSCSVVVHGSGVLPVHCDVVYANGLWCVRATQRDAAVRIGDEIVFDHALTDGDVIELGSFQIEFYGDGRPVPAESGAETPSVSPRPRSRSRKGGRARRASSLRSLDTAGGASKPRARPSGSSNLRRSPPFVPIITIAVLVGAGTLALVVGLGTDVSDPNAASSGPTMRETRDGRVLVAALPSTDDPEPAPARGATDDDLDRADSADSEEPVRVARAPAEDDDASAPDGAGASARRERAAAAEESDRPRSGGTPGWMAGVFSDLAALDTDAALARVASARESTAGEAPAWVAALEDECREIGESRRTLEGSLRDVARSRTVFRVNATLDPISCVPTAALRVALPDSGRVRILGLEGSAVLLGDSRGRELGSCSWWALPTETLVDIVQKSVGRAETPDDLRARIERLLLFAAGPGPASDLTADAATHPATSRVLANPDGWARQKAKLLLESSTSAAGADAASRADLASRLAPLVGLLSRTRPDDAVTEAATSAFIEARAASLPLGALFRAAETEELDGGAVSLVYDLTDEDTAAAQFADFHPVSSDVTQRVDRGRLFVAGELRFATGEPFVDELSVSVRATPLDPEGPNLSVALWTSTDDALTLFDGESRTWLELLREAPGEPADWFLFGAGYRAVVCSTVGHPTEQLVDSETRESIPLPANVVLAGKRGARLHSDTGECIFWEKSPLQRGREVEVSVDWKSDAVDWTIAGRTTRLGTAAQRARLGKVAQREGSFTLLTNGRELALSRITVRGRLASSWTEARRRDVASEELASLRTP